MGISPTQTCSVKVCSSALSRDPPGEEDVLDAGCLLDVLRLYRWHISSFEEQVCLSRRTDHAAFHCHASPRCKKKKTVCVLCPSLPRRRMLMSSFMSSRPLWKRKGTGCPESLLCLTWSPLRQVLCLDGTRVLDLTDSPNDP